jgi:hypothetical protein
MYASSLCCDWSPFESAEKCQEHASWCPREMADSCPQLQDKSLLKPWRSSSLPVLVLCSFHSTSMYKYKTLSLSLSPSSFWALKFCPTQNPNLVHILLQHRFLQCILAENTWCNLSSVSDTWQQWVSVSGQKDNSLSRYAWAWNPIAMREALACVLLPLPTILQFPK